MEIPNFFCTNGSLYIRLNSTLNCFIIKCSALALFKLFLSYKQRHWSVPSLTVHKAMK